MRIFALLLASLLALSSGVSAETKMSQMQLNVKAKLRELGMQVPDERILAASNEDLATALSIMSTSSIDDSPASREAKLKTIFGE